MVLGQPQVQGALGVPWGGIRLLGYKVGSHGGPEPTPRIGATMEGLGLVAHPSVGQGVGWGNQHPPGAGDSPSGRSGCSGVLLKGLRWAWRKRASRSSDAIATVLLGMDTASVTQHWHQHRHQHWHQHQHQH